MASPIPPSSISPSAGIKAPGDKDGPTEDIPDAGTALTSSGDITATEVTSLVPHPCLRVPQEPGFGANRSREPRRCPVASHDPVKKGKEAPGTALAGNGAARGRDIFSLRVFADKALN